MFIRSLTSLVVFAIILGACGKKSNRSKDRTSVTRPQFSKNPPIKYPLADAQCQKETKEVTISRTGIWGWHGAGLASQTLSLQNTRTTDSLKSNIVARNTRQRVWQRKCDGKKLDQENHCIGKDGRPLGWQLRASTNRNLRVCKNDHSYDRETLEGVALTSLHYLNNASEAYQEAMGKKLRDVEVDIHPEFQTIYEKTQTQEGEADVITWIVDNLAYFPGANLIVVFPETKSSKLREQNQHYWESSFVLAHELGHHVEQVHIGDELLQNLSLKWNPMIHGFVSLTGNQDASAKMWTSVSEGFADLAAFYANKGDNKSLANLYCLGKSRDLTKEVFGDEKTVKVLNLHVVDTLLNGKPATSGYCEDPDFTDPHTVGAVLAHGIAKIIEVVHPGVEDFDVWKKRYKLNVKFLEKYVAADKSLNNRRKNHSDLFDPLSNALARAVNESIREYKLNAKCKIIRKGVCELTHKYFPILSTKPFYNEDKTSCEQKYDEQNDPDHKDHTCSGLE